MTEYVKWPNKLYPTEIVSRGRFELRKTCAILVPPSLLLNRYVHIMINRYVHIMIVAQGPCYYT